MAKIAPFERYGQPTKSRLVPAKGARSGAVGGTGTLTCADLPASGRTSSSAVARRKSDHAPHAGAGGARNLAIPNARNRRVPVVAGRPGEGPFTIRFADLRHRVLPTVVC